MDLFTAWQYGSQNTSSLFHLIAATEKEGATGRKYSVAVSAGNKPVLNQIYFAYMVPQFWMTYQVLQRRSYPTQRHPNGYRNADICQHILSGGSAENEWITYKGTRALITTTCLHHS